MRTLAIIGVGLIGGSVALAARTRGLVDRVVGADADPHALEIARLLCRLDECFSDGATAAKQADITVVCTPVDQIASQVLAVASVCPPQALLTDVGSAKTVIVRQLERELPAGCGFVGSHPLAGSEKNGPGFAYDRLFENRVVVVTPTEKTLPHATQKAADFWRGLGARVVEMTPEDHDQALGLTSHLPHVVASALATALPKQWRELTATGFWDTTRIAGGDAELWAAICLQNREAILQALREFNGAVDRFRAELETGNRAGLAALLAQGKRNRDALGS